MLRKSALKDPSDVLDITFDFLAKTHGTGESDWLQEGETILSHTVEADDGLTVDSSELSNADTCVRVWLSGGTALQKYRVTAEIVTSAARTKQWTVTIRVTER